MKDCPNCHFPLELNRFGYYNCTGNCLEAFDAQGEEIKTPNASPLEKLSSAKDAMVFARSKARKLKTPEAETAYKARKSEYDGLIAGLGEITAQAWIDRQRPLEEAKRRGDSEAVERLADECITIVELLDNAETQKMIQWVLAYTDFADPANPRPVRELPLDSQDSQGSLF